jgi:peptidyl-prolyl cis-trans isomerase SurA
MNQRVLRGSILIPAFLFAFNGTAQDNGATLMTIGGTKVTVAEFENVYHKNNSKETPNDAKSLADYVDLFVNFKLKVKEAEELGLDTAKAFKEELAGYRKQLAQPYLTDKDVNEKLLKETYDRLKQDVHASHILVKVGENALPKDTLEAYARVMLIRDAALGKTISNAQLSEYENILKKSITLTKTSSHNDSVTYKGLLEAMRRLSKFKPTGDSFAEIAKLRVPNTDPATLATQKDKVLSDDPSAKENGGDLGYFTALQMVYPFETAAFNTKEGDISMPIRTRYGYHIIKVMDKRTAQGEVLVSHIMVKTPPNMNKEDSLNSHTKITEIYNKLKAGSKFEELATQFSDDKASAKKGGELPWFGTGKMPAEFERAAFALKDKGSYSEPMRTKYGWHIIKLVDKRGLASFEEMKNELKGKVTKDSRSQAGRASLIAKIKSEYKFKENLKARDEFYKVMDTSLFEGRWEVSKAAALKKPMFNFNDKVYTQTDFANFIASHQSKRPKTDIKMIINQLYTQFVDESAVAYEESRLDQKYPEFKALMQEYRDGILLFELTDEKVWSKAVKDTTGAKAFYEKNKEKYMWDERVEATVYTSADEKVAKQVRSLLKKKKSEKDILAEVNKSSQLNLQSETKIFNKGENEFVDKNWMQGTSADMKTKENKTVIVITNKVLKPEPKSFQEAKGMVTADYQAYLEKEWIASLKAKYPVTIDQAVLATIK